MSINRFLRYSVFEPNEIGRIENAYESALLALRLPDRTNPITEIVAKKIIEVARTGERDPARIADVALKELGFNYNK